MAEVNAMSSPGSNAEGRDDFKLNLTDPTIHNTAPLILDVHGVFIDGSVIL